MNSLAPISTTAGKLCPQPACPARILASPKTSVVRPAGTSAFEPASIVGLDAFSLTSPVSVLRSDGSAQMSPSPGSGVFVLTPGAHASLNEDVSDPPEAVRKPPMSAWPVGLVTIELVNTELVGVLAVDTGDTPRGLVTGDRGVVEREMEMTVGFRWLAQRRRPRAPDCAAFACGADRVGGEHRIVQHR